MELDALFLGVMDFLGARRRLGLGAAIDAVHLFGAKSQRDAHGVHRGIAGADDGDATAELQRRVVLGEVAGVHQIAAGEQFVGGQHAVERFTGNAHEARIAGAGADEYGVVAHLGEHLLDGEQAADQRVALELDAELDQLADLGVDHAVGQAEFGDAVFQDAAGLVEGLVDGDVATGLRHVGGASHAGRAGPNDGDAETVRLDIGNVGPALGYGHVADEAFKPADRHRLQQIADRADALALGFLRADAAANGSQKIGIGDDVVGAVIVLLGNLLR